MPSWEILAIIVGALLAGGLSMGGVTLAYFLDKWRDDSHERPGAATHESRRASPFDQAA